MPRTGKRSLYLLALMAAMMCGWAAGCKPRDESGASGEGATTATAPGVQAVSTARPALPARPGLNVLFVSVDTTRPDYLGCYGRTTAKTPNIDRLASEGTRFATCISSMPLTLGSHCTMLTGSYPYVHGARENGIFTLCDNNKTLAEILRDRGYTTRAEVATIILDQKYGMNQGFEHYGQVPAPSEEQVELAAITKREASTPTTTNPVMKVDEQLPGVERSAEQISDAVIEGLESLARGLKPFFFFVHYYDPHWPFSAPSPFAGMFPDDPYSAEISYFDAQLGRILEGLRRLGLEEKTLVILTSDHGEGKGQHGEFTHGPFLYDATLHVPLILRCKGLIPPGQVVASQVRLVDLSQTILDLAGLSSAKSAQMQGTSLAPLLADPRMDLNLVCYSDTIVPKTTYGFSPLRSLRTQGWKYILGPTSELYDLRGDGLELFNRAAADADRALAMRQELWDLIKESPAPPCERATIQAVDKKSLSALRALGYLGSASALDDFATGTELDRFEPRGVNPREHVEEMELMCGALGSLRFGYYEEAERMLRRLHKLLPDHAMVASSLGLALFELGKYAEAEPVIRHAVKLAPDDAEELSRLGGVQAVLKKFTEAEVSSRKATQLDPSSASAWSNLGAALLFQGRHDEAMAALTKADSLSPRLAPVIAMIGAVHRASRRFDQALAEFRRALAIDPRVLRAQSGIALVLIETGKLDEAIEHLNKAVETLPNDAILHIELAKCYSNKGQLEKAVEVLNRAAQSNPKSADIQIILGVDLKELKRYSEAVDALQKAVELGPERVLAHFELAGALQGTGRLKESFVVYENLLGKWPEHLPAYRASARVALELKQTAKAIEILDTGAKQFKEDPIIANDLAWLLATSSDSRLRDGRRAVALAERFSMLADHHDPNRLDTLAAAYAEIGDFEKARSTLDRAIELAEPAGDKSLLEDLKMRRELYQRDQPYRGQ